MEEKIKKIIDGVPPNSHECNSKEETMNIKEATYERNTI